MATYYWLGITGACGNVNSVSNWTMWGPSGACAGILPPAAGSLPGYNDTIIFTRFNVSGACYGVNYYPQVAPQGEMAARGGTGHTDQYFLNTRCFSNCPVKLGSYQNPFSFRTRTAELNLAIPNESSFINIRSGSSISREDATLYVHSGDNHSYWITGVASSIETFTSLPSGNATVILKDLELTRSSTANISIIGIPNTGNSEDRYFIYPTVTGYNGIVHKHRRAHIYIYRGYNSGLDISNIVLGRNATLSFFAEYPNGISGPDSATRTVVNNLICGTRDSVADKTTPVINFEHGVDIVDCELNGGNLNIYNPELGDPVRIFKGYMSGPSTKLTAHTKNVAIGVNGDFVINSDDATLQYTPDINLFDNWDINLVKLEGFTGL